MQEIQIIFNPGKGSVSLSRITAVVGDRVGAMPQATRKGYDFAGWYLTSNGDPHAEDAIRVTAETVLDLNLLGGSLTDVTLVAKWNKIPSKSAAGKKPSSLKKQKRAIAALIVLAVILGAALGVVSFIVDIYQYEDLDGVEYTIKKSKGVYGLYKDGELCSVTDEGYYITTLGTLLSIDPKTGEHKIYAVVDTSGVEDSVRVGTNARVLMFKRLTYDQTSTKDASTVIKRIDVYNQHGEIHVVRDGNNYFSVEGHDTAVLNTELFAQLASACGYTIATQRLENPVRLPDGSIDYSEYGLAPETRVEKDENGNDKLDENGSPVTYDYVPTHYTVTTMVPDAKSGLDKYNVTIGDATVSGGGYYARYADRDTVYILQALYLEPTTLQPVETLVVPMLVTPMAVNDYFQVTNFTYRSDVDYHGFYRDLVLELIGFDIDTVEPNEDGSFSDEVVAKIDEASKLLAEMSDEEFSKQYEKHFGNNSRVVTSFSFLDMDLRQDTLYSSIPYQMSSEYMKGYLPNSDNIGSVLQSLSTMVFDEVTVLSPDENDLEKYGLDEPAHDFSFIHTNAEGQEFNNHFVVSEKTEDGFYYAYSELFDMIVRVPESQMPYLEWEEIEWYDREYFQVNIAHILSLKMEGKGMDAPILFELDNSLSNQSNGINSENLKVYANGQLMDYKLTVTKPSGSTVTESATYNFKRFIQSLLSASMEGQVDLTEEEMTALRNSPEEECVLKLTAIMDDGKGEHKYAIYRFYRYTERKAYMTVEILDTPDAAGDPTRGQGSFYVLSSFCDKLIADAYRFMNKQEVIVDSKN